MVIDTQLMAAGKHDKFLAQYAAKLDELAEQNDKEGRLQAICFLRRRMGPKFEWLLLLRFEHAIVSLRKDWTESHRFCGDPDSFFPYRWHYIAKEN